MNLIEWWLQEQNIDYYLRQDNADMRLTEKGHEIGLVKDDRYERYLNKKAAVEARIR